VSPEDAAEMADLRAFTRGLMNDAERDLGTKPDWIAVDHWNTDDPHVHGSVARILSRVRNL
jgi:type IV secretory pathway VirD2 relaxase